MELELSKKILKRFKIDDNIISINQNKTGLINQTFEIYTTKNQYILQEINTQVFPNYQQGLENIILIKKIAEPLILEIEENLKILIKWDEICMILPKRVIHYDTKVNNFLFEKESYKVIALIDLDTLMPGCVLSDIGDMIRTYSNPVGEEYKDISKVTCNKNIVAAILNGFKDSLTIMERKYLKLGGLAITFMQSVRFLTDYLNDDIYYKTNYENQNLVRANNQFKLYQSLNEIKD